MSPEGAAWRRLAYDEFLAGQVSLALTRANVRRLSGRPLTGDGRIEDAIREALPYSLTGSQEFALAEINADLAEPERMLRLLQGDVGSGKTVVALLAMARAVEAGGQAALMAPTEILARQHLATITPLAERAGLRVAILTGREKGRERAATLAGLEDGSIDIVIGTHALFQEPVTFRDLVLAVVDEQHRFGVHQRLAITAKGDAPDMLVMTATPIPRTLVLTAFGDMDVSRLTEKPAGRQPIRTVTLPLDRLDELIGRIRDAIADGQKVYWICPLVEESEEIKLMSAEDRFAMLKQEFGDIVGLVHGRMKGAEKDEAMRAFKAGETRILVATTVIEVGVDVPDATIMVIEHAERFGLAQLHQLRGRVGRGDKAVVLRAALQGAARRDGEAAAVGDARDRGRVSHLRGGSEAARRRRAARHAPVRHAGLPGGAHRVPRRPAGGRPRRRPADPVARSGSATRARRGAALLLYLFGRDEAVRLLRAG